MATMTFDEKIRYACGTCADKHWQFAKRVLELLKSIEYSGDRCELDYDWDEEVDGETHYDACPSCGCYANEGHFNDCELKAMMDEIQKALEGRSHDNEG